MLIKVNIILFSCIKKSPVKPSDKIKVALLEL